MNKKKEELEVGLLYLGLHSQFIKKFGANQIITRKKFFEKIGRFNHLKKDLRIIVLKEMEEKKLIERVDRDNIKILKLEIDLEKDKNKLYQIAGIF